LIDIQRFFEDNNIEHWTSGKNVADGFINVCCPYCDDTSNHLGFSQNGNKCFCWKCGEHNVFDALCLSTDKSRKDIAVLLKDYKDILSNYYSDFNTKEYNNTTIEVPGSELKIGHRKYLEGRNYDVDYIINKYDLRGTLTYSDWLFSYRIIIPVYYKSKIISYIGRDFTGKQERYMTCKPENEIIPHKTLLYNLDNCYYKEVIVVEGVFDTIRIGDNCCATFGIKYKAEQLALLRERFDKIYVMYDEGFDAQEQALKLCKEFKLMGGKAVNIVLDKGDPGEMTNKEKDELKKDLNL